MNQPEVFIAVVVIRHDTVLLVKREGVWLVPDGALVKGVDLQQTAETVVLTETGLTVSAGRPIYNFDFMGRDDDGALARHRLVIHMAAEFVSGEFGVGNEGDVAWVSVEAMEFMAIDDNTLILLEAVDFLVLEDA